MTKPTMTAFKRTAGCTAKISTITLAMLLMQSNIAHAVVAPEPAANPLLKTIDNIANASYNVSGDSSVDLSSTSNQVQVKSSALVEYGVTLESPPRQTVAPGAPVSWTNILTNPSYSDETIKLTIEIPKSVSNVIVYQDLNNDGIANANEQIVLDNTVIEQIKTAQIKLGQASSINLIVEALSDPNGQEGDIADIEIGAVVVEDPSVQTVTATDSLRGCSR